MPDDFARIIQELLNNNRLMSPVVFDGQMMFDQTPGDEDPGIGDFEYDRAGWSTNAFSEIGGRRSRGVDELVKELTQRGVADKIIQQIPSFHISRFYAPPCAYGFSRPDGRFDRPASIEPLDEEMYQQAIYNLVRMNSNEFARAMQGSNAVRDLYRGEEGAKGFIGKIDLAAIAKQKGWEDIGWTPLDVAGRQFGRNQVQPMYSLSYTQQDKTRGPFWDHCIYDCFFDTRTDERVTRYWRNWAIAVGAEIEM